jgi:hypothetical protein
VERLGGEAEFFDSAGVLSIVLTGFFEELEIARGLVHGFFEAVDGVALQEFGADDFGSAEIGEKRCDGGIDVGEFEPGGEGEKRFGLGVKIGVVAGDARKGETMLDDEIDEGVVGGSEGRGLHTQFPNSTFHMPKKKGKASGIRHRASEKDKLQRQAPRVRLYMRS